jgi:hypothetical protein
MLVASLTALSRVFELTFTMFVYLYSSGNFLRGIIHFSSFLLNLAKELKTVFSELI